MAHVQQKESLEKTLSIVEGCFRKFGLRRLFGLSSTRSYIVREFALNLCFVACGIRSDTPLEWKASHLIDGFFSSGYLLDSFSPPDGEQCLDSLLEHLREISAPFAGLKLVCAVGQIFIVNASLVREKAKAVVAKPATASINSQYIPDNYAPSFVLLGADVTMTTPEPQLLSIITCVSDAQEHITLPSNLTARTLVPLAGFLLDYPVCYVPASDDQTVFLSGVSLDLYECVLVNDRKPARIPDSHALFKFTCPTSLGDHHRDLHRHSIMDSLQKVLTSRLVPLSSPFSLKITHNTVIFDRVAL